MKKKSVYSSSYIITTERTIGKTDEFIIRHISIMANIISTIFAIMILQWNIGTLHQKDIKLISNLKVKLYIDHMHHNHIQ